MNSIYNIIRKYSLSIDCRPLRWSFLKWGSSTSNIPELFRFREAWKSPNFFSRLFRWKIQIRLEEDSTLYRDTLELYRSYIRATRAQAVNFFPSVQSYICQSYFGRKAPVLLNKLFTDLFIGLLCKLSRLIILYIWLATKMKCILSMYLLCPEQNWGPFIFPASVLPLMDILHAIEGVGTNARQATKATEEVGMSARQAMEAIDEVRQTSVS